MSLRQLAMCAALGCAVLAMISCGGGSSPEAPTASRIDVSGTWVGTTVSNTGAGTARVTLAQSGNNIAGTWGVTSGALANSGTVSGTSAGANLSLSLTPSDPRTCGYSATATVSDGARMSGTFATTSCTVASTGTLTLTKQ